MDCSDLFGRTACCFGICGAAQAMQTAMEEALGWFFQLKCGVFPDFENIRCVQILRFFEDSEIQKWRNFMKAPGSECPRSNQYATAWPPRYHQCCWLKSGSTSWKCRLAKKNGEHHPIGVLSRPFWCFCHGFPSSCCFLRSFFVTKRRAKNHPQMVHHGDAGGWRP